MLELKAQNRDKFGRQTKKLRQQGILPAVLYGEGIKESIALQVEQKEFEKVFREAGTSSLISLEWPGQKYNVLIYDSQKNPLTGEFLHIDFYGPSTEKEIIAEVPLIFIGQAPAEKDLGGNLVREIQSLEAKGMVQNLPKEIEVDLAKLKTFEDKVLVGDLLLPEGITTTKNKEDIVALVVPPKEEEKGLEKPAGEVKPTEEKAGKK